MEMTAGTLNWIQCLHCEQRLMRCLVPVDAGDEQKDCKKQITNKATMEEFFPREEYTNKTESTTISTIMLT